MFLYVLRAIVVIISRFEFRIALERNMYHALWMICSYENVQAKNSQICKASNQKLIFTQRSAPSNDEREASKI